MSNLFVFSFYLLNSQIQDHGFSYLLIINSELTQEFPPASKLDPIVYGDQASTITKEHIENSLDGLSIYEVIFCSRFATTVLYSYNS
jgi:hypothetical protein